MRKLRIITLNQSPKRNLRRQRYHTQQALVSSHNPYSPDHRQIIFKHTKSISTQRQAKNGQTNQQIKEKLYHKQPLTFIKKFQSVQANFLNLDQYRNTSIHHGTSSNQIKDERPVLLNLLRNPNQLTILQPFDVSDKKTINQSIKKDVSSIQANRMRVFQASYRWKKRSGRNVRVSCQFQSGLRESSQQKHQRESDFINYVKPIRYKILESQRYNLKDIICDYQKKIFSIEGTS